MHREILKRAAKCKPCTEMCNNLKPIISAAKWKPRVNQNVMKIQIDFGGRITTEKDQDMHILACIDRFSKNLTVEVFDKTNGPNIVKTLDEYVQTQIHGVPRNTRLEQTTCLIGKQLINFVNGIMLV